MHTFPMLLIGIFTSSVVASAPAGLSEDGEKARLQPRWECYAAEDAQERKQQVEHGMLPRVVFVGESQAISIESRMVHYKTPALSVAVIRRGKLDWSAAWGQLQIDGVDAGCDSLFQAGSLAKPATLFAALRMQQQGEIDFDADVQTYLTSYHLPAGRQTDANPITFRNLLSHTSGITPGGYAGYAQGQPIPDDLQTVRAQAPSNSRIVEVRDVPNTAVRYSGGGYTVVEIALQDRLKKPFEQIMRTWLIAPVGMRQADFTQPAPASSLEHTARGHLADGGEVPGGWHNHPEQAAAGLWATASDLAVLLLEVRKGYLGRSKVFTQASIRELLAKPVEGHVYGFRLIGEGDQVFITHYGGTVGYRAGMTLNLKTGDGAVFLTNSDNGSELGAEFLGAVSRVHDWPAFGEAQVTRAIQPVDVLQSLTGRYQFKDGPAVSVVYENAALTLVFPNGDRYAMTPITGAPREFIHPETAVRASFGGESTDLRMQLYGETGQREASGE